MSKRKKQKTSPVSFKQQFESGILSVLNESPGRAYSLKQIAKKLGLKKRDDIKAMTFSVYDLEGDGKIKQLSDGLFTSNIKEKTLTGIVDHVSSRFAYVSIGEDRPDVFIKARDLGSAVDGDTVQIALFPTRHGEHPEGKVVEIVKRNRTQFVGRLELSKNFAFVVADFRKIHKDFFIAQENIGKARSRDKVIVEVIDWGDGEDNPEAKVVEVLGKAGENEAEIHSIMAEFGLPFRFPEQVEKAARKIDEGITPKEISKRWDFRLMTTFTIDPEDAKDFDDALSLEILPNGNYCNSLH